MAETLEIVFFFSILVVWIIACVWALRTGGWK